MSVYTEYDRKRDNLRDELKECLAMAKELVVGEDIWGYGDMPEDYALKVYLSIKDAINKV